MEKEFRNQRFAVRLGANRVRNERADRELFQSNRSLLINAEIGECGTASASGEGRYIYIVKVFIGAGYCRGGVVGSKNRTIIGAMQR